MKKILKFHVFAAWYLLLTLGLAVFILPNPAQASGCDNPYLPFKKGYQVEYRSDNPGNETAYSMKVIDSTADSAKIEYKFTKPQKINFSQNLFCNNGNITTDTYMNFEDTANIQMTSNTDNVEGTYMPEDLHVGSVWTTKYTMSINYNLGNLPGLGSDSPPEAANLPAAFSDFKMTIQINNKAIAEEQVTVPAGSFTAIKVQSVISTDFLATNFNLPNTNTSLTMHQWWVKNVGLVKISSQAGGQNFDTVAVSIGGVPLWDNPTVEAVAEKAVAPAAAAVTVANTAIAAQSTVSLDVLRYLLFFISQPLLLLKRKKYKAWGTVYNSLTKLPEDLAIVRLYEAAGKKLITTQVTNADGAFSFIVPAGKYILEAHKNGLEFPSKLLKGAEHDDPYSELYYGGTLSSAKNEVVLTPTIPLDPLVEDLSDAKIRKKLNWQKYQAIIALVGPGLGLISFIIKPSLLVSALLILSILTYLFFRRFTVKKVPKKWGKVSEDKTATNIPGAVMRVFALPFNKLVEYKVTDGQGRYNFVVGNAKFFLTVAKDGYVQKQTQPVDFTHNKEASVIAEDIKLQKK